MSSIIDFLNELKREELFDNVPLLLRKYNDVSYAQTEQTYSHILTSKYNDALSELINLKNEKLELVQKIVIEVANAQQHFDTPSKELLSSMLSDYHRNNSRGLKDDYDFLCFVKSCQNLQRYFLGCFCQKIDSSCPCAYDDVDVTVDVNVESKAKLEKEVIKGVKGLAKYLKIGSTSAQKIINSEILQRNGIAYRLGKVWNFNKYKLDEFLSENPNILYPRNQKNG